MESEIQDIREALQKLMADVAFIKRALLLERGVELSDFALQELDEARNVPESKCMPHEEVKKMILES